MLIFFYCLLAIMIPMQEQLYGEGTKALTIVPVADLLGHPLTELLEEKKVELAYEQIPHCGQRSSLQAHRLHQLLFNEIITIEEEKDQEVKITIPNLYYENKNKAYTPNYYWALKKNFIPLEELKKYGIKLEKIPQPIDYSVKNQAKDEQVAILIMPYHNKELNRTFSAGTRFVIDKKADENSFLIHLFAFNPLTKKMITIAVPKNMCIYQPNALTSAEKRALFVHCLKKWAALPGIIPYVWGGCSFTNICTEDTVIAIQGINKRGETVICYERAQPLSGPKQGFDCAGLISRVAQACSIPYFFKNTTTLAQNLRPLLPKELLQEGDLLWFPGHVIIVSDMKKNRAIEARAYANGYGKVHEVTLSDLFQGVKTYDELITAYHEKKPLYRLDKNKCITQKITLFKLLKLESVWKE